MTRYALIPVLRPLQITGTGRLFLTAVEIVDDRLALRFRGVDQDSLVQRSRPFPTVTRAGGEGSLPWIVGRSGGSGFEDTWDVVYELPDGHLDAVVIDPGGAALHVDLADSEWHNISPRDPAR